MTKNLKILFLKNFSLLLQIRIVNIIMLIIAMYISAIFLFDNFMEIKENLHNLKLHGIVFSSVFCVSAGYIINYFYDQDKDAINEPLSTNLRKFISTKTYLKIYILFNVISLFIASLLSYRIFIFFLVYQFFIWFYSHKLSKIIFINNITYSVLGMFPFLALFLFYDNYSEYILLLAANLFLLFLLKEIYKDFISSKADYVFGYKTLPNILGIKITKIILVIIQFILVIICIKLNAMTELKEIRLYFLLTSVVSFVGMIGIWMINRLQMKLIIFMIKFWIFIGTISLLFINGNPLPLWIQL